MLWARYQRLLTTHAPKSLRRLLRVLRMLLLEVPSLLGRVSVDVGAGVGVDVVLVPVLLLPLLAAILRLLPYQRPSRLSFKSCRYGLYRGRHGSGLRPNPPTRSIRSLR